MAAQQSSSQTMSVTEAAAHLGISRWLAYELVKRDEFPVPILRIGRLMKVPRAALDAYLAGNGTPKEPVAS